VRGGLLEEGLGGDDDAADGHADDEVADQRRPDVRKQGENNESNGDAAETAVDQQGVAELFAEGVEAVDTDEHAEADHRGDDAEHLSGGVERVAHVDGDKWAKAADDKHSGGHRENDEEQSGVVDDEAETLLHIEPDFAGGGDIFCGGGCGFWRRSDQGNGGDEGG